jgi:uncharacterized protein (TIRG00374 family)
VSGRTLRAVVGIAISIVAVWLVVRSVNVEDTFAVLRSAAPAWIAAMLLFLALDILVRAIRWSRLLAAVGGVRFGIVVDGLLVGYLANNVLPARLGELVRSHRLGEMAGMSRTTVLGTVVVERVVDTVAVVAIAAVAILVLQVRGVVADAVLVGLALSALLIIGLAIGIAAHRLPGAERIAASVRRWPRVGELATKLRSGLAVAGRPRTLTEVLALSAVAWFATLLAFAAAGQAIGLELLIGEAALFAAGTALATAIPAGPGYVGTFELAAVRIGDALGVPSSTALALALLTHVGILVLTSLGGGIATLWPRGRWRRQTTIDASGSTASPEPTAPEPTAPERPRSDRTPPPSGRPSPEAPRR